MILKLKMFKNYNKTIKIIRKKIIIKIMKMMKMSLMINKIFSNLKNSLEKHSNFVFDIILIL